MRWSLLIAVFGLSITDVASFAQRPPDDQRLSSTRSASEDAGFFASTGVVRFQLIQGRLCLDAPRHRKGSQNREKNGRYESITVTAQRGIPSMHYVYQAAKHHLTLSVQQGDAMRVESWSRGTSERSILEQPELGTITWTHMRGDLKQTHRGATLFHIRHADPSTFDSHYGLLIKRLLRGKSLAALSEATQNVMLEQSVNPAIPEVESIYRCVDRLGSRRRSTRIAAENQLLSWGSPIVPTIRQLRWEDLDGEQKDRLREILQRLRPRVDDTPATLARLLANDRQYWAQMAAGLSSDQMRIANNHLQRVGLKSIELPSEPVERIASARE